MLKKIFQKLIGFVIIVSILCSCNNQSLNTTSFVPTQSEVTESNTAETNRQSSVNVSSNEYEVETTEYWVKTDSKNIYGVIHRPVGFNGKAPLLVISHGLGGTADSVTNYADDISKTGFVVYRYDFSGGGEKSRSEGKTTDMSPLTERDDLRAVLNEVLNLDYIDKDNVYLMGCSQGGLVTAITSNEYADKIKAEILLYPAFVSQDMVHEGYNSIDEIPESQWFNWITLGKKYYVDMWDYDAYVDAKKFTKDALLLHGDKDVVVPLRYADRLANEMPNIEYHVIKGGEHGFREGYYAEALNYIKDFLNKELKNKFGLVYQNAIEENVDGKVNIKPVEYKVDGIRVSANMYLPANFDENKKYKAITVAHPNGGVKEQVAGLFAERLANLGYITIAADARYQGASGGEPRNRDYPQLRIDDVSGMIDYLDTLSYIDKDNIGSLGICGGGGYTLAAAEIDKRIKAVSTISMFNTGRIRRNGLGDSDVANANTRLEKAAKAREKMVEGIIEYEGGSNSNATEADLRAMMERLPEGLYRDGVEYYGITHSHPNSNGRYTTESLQKLIAFDVDDRVDLVTQPLLMIAGSIADTKYMTDSAFEKAVNAKNKKLVEIEGAKHIDTYWVPEYVEKEVEELKNFFAENLK